MKIVAQDYSLIDNEYIKKMIEAISTELKRMIGKNYSDSSILTLKCKLEILYDIESKLIPFQSLNLSDIQQDLSCKCDYILTSELSKRVIKCKICGEVKPI